MDEFQARAGRAKVDEAALRGRPVPMESMEAASKALKSARQHLERGLSFPFAAVREADKHLRVLMSEQMAGVELQQGGYSQEVIGNALIGAEPRLPS